LKQLTGQFTQALDLGIVQRNLTPKIGLDIGNQFLHLALLRTILGCAIGLNGHALAIDGPLALFQSFFQVGIYVKATHQGVSTLDVDVDIGQGLQLGRIFIIGVLQ
jgi:hypothetical protein